MKEKKDKLMSSIMMCTVYLVSTDLPSLFIMIYISVALQDLILVIPTLYKDSRNTQSKFLNSLISPYSKESEQQGGIMWDQNNWLWHKRILSTFTVLLDFVVSNILKRKRRNLEENYMLDLYVFPGSFS